MVDDDVRIFGTRDAFALELRLLPDPHPEAAPLDGAGSWGEWRLWVAGLNLCTVDHRTRDGIAPAAEVRWYMAPLFRWIIDNWMPLLHETRLPAGGRWGDGRPRRARLAYLSMLESAGDDLDRFGPWQAWASRHALRSAAEGGIVPDVFFQRVGDEIEVSWGDRVEAGAEASSFVTDDGMSHVGAEAMATALRDALDWFCRRMEGRGAAWVPDLDRRWRDIGQAPAGRAALHWFLDGREDEGPLSAVLAAGLEDLGRPLPLPADPWWGSLAPEVAMFGALAPQMSERAAVTLLSCYFEARHDGAEAEALTALRRDDPAWRAASPWANGYSLAEDVLDEADPDPGAPRTDVDALLRALGIAVRDVGLGEAGPRGVALAGGGLRPTVLVNRDHTSNRQHGRRFTLAHELCHILFDRDRARPLAHGSTPWAPPAVEQRANAFAAMLLMPPGRARRPPADSLPDLRRGIHDLARRLKVSGAALKRHLANIGEISPIEGGIAT